MIQSTNPAWWNDEKTTAWDRVKEALRRDWEQTKADFTKHQGQELNQDVGDTVKQAVGKEPIPPPGMPNVDWDHVEPGMRYGWGAASHYKDEADWDDRVEGKLKEEWNDLKSGRTWDETKDAVRRGWDSARRKVS
ncbi:hypothetical protein [Chondromyces apiculatus]|uniref:Uncharacterized protein n=1 Tax=Chondromyces apiculatus DSM 436 TaxID=1192034 RepID=A0A017TAS8_9BACT|nr:hypothetical protein [Chondromyces apiculatus]EYF06344.1 Hypothetical protein CAP_1874 [Chondromyces apiculatus DSM 436]